MFRRITKIFHRKSEQNDSSDFIFLGNESIGLKKGVGQWRNDRWVEDSFINSTDEELAKTDKNYLGLSISAQKMIGLLLFMLIILALLLSRAFFLQVFQGESYLAVAEKNRIRIFHLQSPRGIVYDINGVPLVKNIPSFAVFITPYDINFDETRKEETLLWLKKGLDASEIEYQESLEKVLSIKVTSKEYFEPVIVADQLDYSEAMALRIESAYYPGISVEVVPERNYLLRHANQIVSSMSHVLGYGGKISPKEYLTLEEQGYLLSDTVGKTGVEKVYEQMLRGQYGKEQVEVDSSGKAVKIIAREEMVKGDNLYLSIDIKMQAKLEEILEKYLGKLNKSKASAIVMNPQTGKIYSLISLPAFNNNLFTRGISSDDYNRLITDGNQPLFNRVISGEYPSGSTFKPVVGTAALEHNVIKEYSSFLSSGGIRISSWFFPDWKSGGHGITDVRKAISESVNTFFYIIGGGYGDIEGLGASRIKEYAEMFGLGALTGIDLPNEKAGFLPSPEWKEQVKDERWYIGDTYHFAIGQGDVLVTPLQVANFTAVFANKGKLYSPTVIDRYYDQEKGEEVIVKPKLINQSFVDQKNLQIIRQGMKQAATSGSARILNSLPVSSGAKTGTAQWGTDKTPHSWFTSFAPYNDAELVVTILVEEGGEGSVVAAPIAYEFMHWYFRYYRD